MDKSSPITRHVFAEDRTYKKELIQFEGLETTVKVGSLIAKVKKKSELNIFLNAITIGQNTEGMSVPIYKAADILGDRVLMRGQVNLRGEQVDPRFNALLESSLFIDADPDAFSYPATVEAYTGFVRTLDPRLAFGQRILASFNRDEDDKLKKNVDAYNRAWEITMADPRERIRLGQAYVLYPFRLGGRIPSVLTRTMESTAPESLDHAALLNKEASSICRTNNLPKVLTLSIGHTALSNRSTIKEIVSMIMDKNAFGNKFDILHLSMPNQDIHNSSAQRKNFAIIAEMINDLKIAHGVKTIVNDVDIAFAEVCVGLGFAYASTPLDGNTSVTHFARYDQENIGYGRAPIPAELDWLPFGSFVEEYKDNGNRYPYYSATARSLDGHTDFKAEVDARDWNPIRKTIFTEAIDDLNLLNFQAAEKKEFVEGVKKKIWDSNKKNYIDLLKAF